jgi:cupin superfamily acireductone dioxygenase involved in methionine salvage
LDTLDAITSLSQLDTVIDTIQSKKEYTNADIVALVLVMAEIEKIADLLEQKEQDLTE